MIEHLYFVRHGQSTANAANVYAGQDSSVQLTDLGRQQAMDSGTAIKGLNIDLIISSDLDRAEETARIIAGQLGLPETAVKLDARLREINIGQLANQPDKGFAGYMRHVELGTDQTVETPEQAESRVRSFLSTLVQQGGRTVLLVAHVGIGNVLQSVLIGTLLNILAGRDTPNAQPFELPLDRLKETTA